MISEKSIAAIHRLHKLMPVPLGETRPFQTSDGAVNVTATAQGLNMALAAVPSSELTAIGRIDRAVVISLNIATERRKTLAPHLAAHGIVPQWFPAIDGRTKPAWWRHSGGAWGCLRSHEAVIKAALRDGAQSLLVMEDDARLCFDFSSQLAALLRNAPHDWQALWLGGTLKPGRSRPPVAPGVVAGLGFYGTTAYILRRSVMATVLAALAAGRDQVDNLFNRLAESGRLRVYAPAHWIAQQVAGYSFILNRQRGSDRRDRSIFLPPPVAASEGVLILSTGAKRRGLVLNAASSIRRTMPSLGVRIVSDAVVPNFDTTIVAAGSEGHKSRALKTTLITESPWECGVMIDDDVLALRPFPKPSDVLGDADLAMRLDAFSTIGAILQRGVSANQRGWLSAEEAEFTKANYPDCESKPHYNSGVVFYRKTPAVMEFLAVWRAEWERFRGVDQIALFRALEITGLRVKRLAPDLHHRVLAGRKEGSAALVHFCGAKWKAQKWMAERHIPVIAVPAKPCCGKTLAGLVRGRSVAVVGNGPTANEFCHADKIDACDIVIRFNNFATGASHPHVGAKADVIALPLGVPYALPSAAIWRGVSLAFSVTPPGDEEVNIKSIPTKIDRFPASRYAALQESLGFNPTTGMAVLEWLLTECEPASLYVTGFSFAPKPKGDTHYFPAREFSYAAHSPVAELGRFAGLLAVSSTFVETDEHITARLASMTAAPRKPCCGKKPTLRDKAAGVTRAIGGVLAELATGEDVLVSKPARAARLGACNACEHLKKRRCELCGCYVSLKSRLARETCPAGKWPSAIGNLQSAIPTNSP